MSLEQNVKNWVILDNKIKELNQEIKLLKNNKLVYDKNIIDYISHNNLTNASINIKNGKLKFVDTNYPQILTYKFLYESISKYFNNTEKASEIVDFIKSQRDIKTIKEIKRYTVNN